MVGTLRTDQEVIAYLTQMQSKIGSLLEAEMKHFSNSIPDYVDEIVTYLYNQGGKRLRPTFFILLAEFLGAKNSLGPFALAIELIHTMSLYHDDVIDDATSRRGAPTAHIKWDEATAIVGGDILHSLIHRHIIDQAVSGRVDQDTTIRFLKELLDIEVEIGSTVLLEMKESISDTIPSLDDAIQITAGKTAPLFAFSAKAAAIVAGHEQIANNLYEFGYKYGLAFQLLDDLLDYFSTDKDMGGDLREAKKTPLIVLIAERFPNKIKNVLGKTDLSEKEIVEFRNTFSSEFTEIISWIEDYLHQAKEHIDAIGIPSDQLAILFSIIRTKIIEIKQSLSAGK